MTKQEEIREGVAEDIGKNISPEWRSRNKGYLEIRVYDVTDTILAHLHSQGVVIKVDRELPKVEFFDPARPDLIGEYERQYIRGMERMLKEGYVAVEPLVQEEQ